MLLLILYIQLWSVISNIGSVCGNKHRLDTTNVIKLLPRPSSSSSSEQDICALNCQNGGVCRFDLSFNNYICYCKQGYSGRLCQNDDEKSLTHCSESTCKHNGMCSGSYEHPYCQCGPIFGGKQCERVKTIYTVSVKVRDNHGFMEQETLCKQLHESIKYGKYLSLAPAFSSCTLLSENMTSHIQTIQLVLDIPLIITNVSVLEEHLSTGLQDRKRRAIAMTLIRSITVDGPLDHCTSGLNDCSTNAHCISKPDGNFECVCKSFSIDSSIDVNYPGRRCLYDGLIIFSFAVVGGIIGTLSVLLCGCRRTLWRRRRLHPETIDLVNFGSTYDI